MRITKAQVLAYLNRTQDQIIQSMPEAVRGIHVGSGDSTVQSEIGRRFWEVRDLVRQHGPEAVDVGDGEA
jgi:hypothetical protein